MGWIDFVVRVGLAFAFAAFLLLLLLAEQGLLLTLGFFQASHPA
jgi:hypothetical protein